MILVENFSIAAMILPNSVEGPLLWGVMYNGVPVFPDSKQAMIYRFGDGLALLCNGAVKGIEVIFGKSWIVSCELTI